MSTKHEIPLFDKQIILNAVKDSFKKLNPAYLIKNPVMFIVGIGAVLTTIISITDLVEKTPASFDIQIAVWLWFTVLFANFAEAIAEGRGKAQSENLRKSRTNTIARKLVGDKEVKVSALNFVLVIT
jgi:K+-transporting ATPase ATPase B chain